MELLERQLRDYGATFLSYGENVDELQRSVVWACEKITTLRADLAAAVAERDALREAVEELFLSRKEYADKAAGAQYGAVWARYMNAFSVLERELRRRADARKGGKDEYLRIR